MEKIREDLVFKDDLCRVYYVWHGENGLSKLFRTVILVGSNEERVSQYLPITESSENMTANTWGYKNSNGPNTWILSYPLAAGDNQSPVNISSKSAVYDSELADNPLKITYKKENKLEAENTGTSYKIKITKESFLSGGPMKDIFRLEQFHLHWGSQNEHGSEHTIDGKSYAAELHLVHYNVTKYPSFAAAASKEDGLCVLGIMIKKGAENKGFEVLSQTARSLKISKPKALVDTSFNPDCLLPANRNDFWTYRGSLTTPPCYESVQWIVFKDHVEYSAQQLTSLRNLMDENGQCIENNFRPPCPLGTRKIRSTFKYDPE